MLLTNILKKMKRLVLLLTVVLLLAVSQNLQAQDVYSPWTASLSTNAINNPVLKAPNNLGRFKTWNWEVAGFKGALSRHLTGKLSLEGSVTLTGIKQNYIDVDKKFSLIALDGLVKYNLINNFNVNPYVAVGGGLTWVDTLGKSLTANAGVGLNVWITYNFGLTGQSIYKHALDDYGISHFQHSVGLIFKFGGTDNDNDGIINKEDNCTGKFWEGRFKSQALLDEAALLSCMAYVDLNPIRAAIASNLEASDFTSIKERITQFKSYQRQKDKRNSDCKTVAQPKSLLPFAATLDTQALPFSYADYFELVDWSGRQIDPKKRGFIAKGEPKILSVLAIDSDDWLTTVKEFRRQYGNFAGGERRLRDYAHRHGRSWCKGVG